MPTDISNREMEIMIRYYDTKLRCEVFEENKNTLTNEDELVFSLRNSLKEKKLKFRGWYSYLEDIEVITR